MAAWRDGYWTTSDGLRLHYRDYPGGDAARPPIICIPGLTRNARDWEALAARLSPGWRVICVDLRGRGESAYAKDPTTYTTPTYVEDLEALLRALEVDRFVLFGTSLGGLLSMLLGAAEAKRVQGVLINDAGPVLGEEGLARIRTYVGRAVTWPTWVHAARDLAATHRVTYPDWGLDRWLVFAKRLAKLNSSGRITLDYDTRIAETFRLAPPTNGMDMWTAFSGLREIPVTIVRGETSDILTPEVLARMQGEHPGLDAVTVPGVGHSPLLDEPQAEAAIDRLLARVAERPALA